MDEAFFKARYEADAANKAKQSWGDYWGWVSRFYEGQRFPPIQGWSKRVDELSSKHAGRVEVRAALEETGRLLAAEWAKDNSVRKVSTGDLQSWGKKFGDAAKEADALLAALKDVQAAVRARSGAP